MLGTRLVFGLMMVAGLVLALVVDEQFAPFYPCWFVLATVALGLAARELIGLLSETAAAPSGNSVVGGVLALVIANWAPHLVAAQNHSLNLSALDYDPAGPLNVLAWPFLTFTAVIMLGFLIQGLQFERPGRTMAKIAGSILAVAYLGLLSSFTLQMRWFSGHHQGLLALVFLFAVAKGADTGAYAVGRLFGRRKLWPSLSPGKTIEGALGGLAAGVLAALIVVAIAHYGLAAPTFTVAGAVVYGVFVSIAAQIGDLMESMIKRDCLRKDASSSVPGFGGVLDVLDSILFAGPIAYLIWMGIGP